MGLRDLLHYDTVQIVRIRNVRVALIFHFAQLAILGYIVGYGLIYKKAYQATGPVVGSADIKVKGVGYMNQTLPWNGPSNNTCPGNSCFHVYDAYDLVLPPMEENAVFCTTNMWVTKNQVRGVCPSYNLDNVCDPDAQSCKSLHYVNNGRQTGEPGSCRTNYTDPHQLWKNIVPKGSYCDVYGWCPTELEVTDKKIINNFGIKGVNEFTVFVRQNVNFPKFGKTLDNTAGATQTTNFVNLWTLEEMVNLAGWSWEAIQNQGITLAMNAVWNCDFDQSSTCSAVNTFVRLDEPKSKLSHGFNFRSVEYLHDAKGTRQLTKHYGVRLIVLISGVGSQFDWAALFTAIGAGIGLLSVATLIADFIATNLLQNKGIYRQAKYNEVVVNDDEGESETDSFTKDGHLRSDGLYQPPRTASLINDELDSDASARVESWGLARYPTAK